MPTEFPLNRFYRISKLLAERMSRIFRGEVENKIATEPGNNKTDMLEKLILLSGTDANDYNSKLVYPFACP